MKKNLNRTTALFLTAVCLFFCCSPAFASNTLVYSELYSIPSNYDSYNCYGYAIGENENVDPGYYSGRTFSLHPITILNNTMADLTALGCDDVHTVSSSYTLQPGEHMIAFAYGTWVPLYNLKMNNALTKSGDGPNYHFWRKDSNGGYWYHKYGTPSAIMRLKSGYNPSNITITSELFDGDGIAVPAYSYLPSSIIYYIAFTPNTSINSMP